MCATGFIGNRMLAQYIRQAGELLEEGALLPQQIDGAMEKFGMANGAAARWATWPATYIGWAVRKHRYKLDPNYTFPKVYDRHVRDWALWAGRQARGGTVLQHRARQARSDPDPVVERDEPAVLKVGRHHAAQDRLAENRPAARVCAGERGAKIVEEGIAQRGPPTSTCLPHRYGFPLFRGGPSTTRTRWAFRRGRGDRRFGGNLPNR